MINATEDRPEILREVDIAIIWGTEIPDGFEGIELMSVTQTPVASPALLGAGGLEEQLDLFDRHRILHEGNTDAWRDWCSVAGIPSFKPSKEWIFDDPALMIEACLRGHGIALGTLPLIDGLISEGRLVALSRNTLPAPRHYFLTRAVPPSGGRAASAAFRWLDRAT